MASRRTVAHRTIRLMLLGSPPDMIHGALLHRTHAPYDQTKAISAFTYNIIYENDVKIKTLKRVFNL